MPSRSANPHVTLVNEMATVSSVVLWPTNADGPSTAGATNFAHPNTKALSCLAFLCVCHTCRSCLCASLCQAIFSHKPAHVLAGVCGSWSNQQRKTKSEHQSLHHRIETQTLLLACSVAQDYAPESVTFDLRVGPNSLSVGGSSPHPNIAGARWAGLHAALRTELAPERRYGLGPRGIFAKSLFREIIGTRRWNSMYIRQASITILVALSLCLPAKAQSFNRQDLNCAVAATIKGARAGNDTTRDNGFHELIIFFLRRLNEQDDQTNWARVVYDRSKLYPKRDSTELLAKCRELYQSSLHR